jgi:hypothetical protein
MPRTRGQAPERSGEPIDIAQAWKLRVVNKLSFGEIAKQMGCSKSTVHAALQRLNDLVPDPHVVNAYEGVEAHLLTAGKARLLRSLMDEEAIEKASLNNRAFAFSQLFNAHRLATHQSTENVGVLGKLILQAEDNLGAGKATTRSGQAALQEEVAAKSADHKA